MRGKPIVLILIASGCGLVASIGISQVMERSGAKGDAGSLATEEIFVAMNDIDIGGALTAENVKPQPWPKDKVPTGAVTRREDLADHFPRTRIFRGEPILQAKLTDSSGDIDSLKIPEGYRAVSIRVTMDSSVSGLVLPGDRVDIVAIFRKNSDVPKTTTRTILRDVRVFAVNSETKRAVDTAGNLETIKTVSVLVKDSQVEPLMLALELGVLRLSLRRPNDTSRESGVGAADVDTLLGRTPETTDDRNDKPNAPSGTGSFLDWLKSQQAAQPVAAPAADAGPAVTFEMQVCTPEGATVYRWRGDQQLPEVVSPAGGGGAPGGAASHPASTVGAAESTPDESSLQPEQDDGTDDPSQVREKAKDEQ